MGNSLQQGVGRIHSDTKRETNPVEPLVCFLRYTESEQNRLWEAFSIPEIKTGVSEWMIGSNFNPKTPEMARFMVELYLTSVEKNSSYQRYLRESLTVYRPFTVTSFDSNKTLIDA
jgi:hypothetical protein